MVGVCGEFGVVGMGIVEFGIMVWYCCCGQFVVG